MTRRSQTSTAERGTEPQRPPASGRPQEAQDASHPEAIPDEHRASVMRSLADLQAGRIATEDEVEAVYHRFGR